MKFIAVLCLCFVALASASPSKVKVVEVNRRFPMSEKMHAILRHNTVLTHLRKIQMNTHYENRNYVAQVNEYVDNLFVGLDEFIIESGLDPMALPDINEGFEYKPALITYHGQINLTNGVLFDLHTLHRGGDAILKYEMELLNLQIPISFNDLIIDYDYHADIMDIGPTGKLEGKISNIQLFADVVLDFYNMEILLQDFRIDDVGVIDLNFSGNDLIDWLLELLVDAVTSVLHDTIIGLVEGIVAGMAQDIVADINVTLQNIFDVTQA